MMNNISQLRSLLDSANTLLTEIKIDYDSVIGPRTKRLVEISKQIIPIINEAYPDIAQILINAIQRITFRSSRVINITRPPFYQNVVGDYINAYSFGDIRTTIKILDALFSTKLQNEHTIFISHSSNDKDIVSDFCDRILRLGIGVNPDKIFCTSIEDMNIQNGADIRKHIRENILTADFSFLLISDNYKKSEICLNEMGAVWANDNNVRFYLLPNTGFEKIGWLCDSKQAEQLADPITLDKLYNELVSYYNIKRRMETWSRQRETFVNKYSGSAIKQSGNQINMTTSTVAKAKDEIILALLKETPDQSSSDLAISLGLSERTVRRYLELLRISNKVEVSGTLRNKKWRAK